MANKNKINHSDIWIRASKTAVQSFLGVFVLSLSDLLDTFKHGGLPALKSAVLALGSAALAAAVSALWNYYLQYRDASSA